MKLQNEVFSRFSKSCPKQILNFGVNLLTIMVPQTISQGGRLLGVTSALKTTLVVTSIRAALFHGSTVAAGSVNVNAGVHKPVGHCHSRGRPQLIDVCVWKPPTRYCHPSWCHPNHGTISTSHFCKRCYMTEEEILKDPDCEADELKKRFEQKSAYVIDVRKLHELEETGKIPGAVHIPLDIFEEALKLDDSTFKIRYGTKKPELDGSNVVINCRSGVRSLTALKIARSLGFHRSRHLPGGFLLWKEKFENLVAKV